METILITGGAGFIASSLAKNLLKTNKYEIVIIDNLLTGSLKNLPDPSNYTFLNIDVNNYDELSKICGLYNFDYIFHYAAVVGVQRTLRYPLAVLDDIKGLKNIFEVARQMKVKRIFYSSSSEVYGDCVETPMYEEKTPLNSRLPYAVVKNIGECFCKSYKQDYDLDYTIFRFFNTYGPNQSADFVISKFLDAAINNNDITIYGSGMQCRTFCYIQDNTDFTIKLLEDKLFVNDIVNVGNDSKTTIRQLAELIIKVTESKSQIKFLPALKQGDMLTRQPDLFKMRSAIDWELTALEDGLNKMLMAWQIERTKIKVEQLLSKKYA